MVEEYLAANRELFMQPARTRITHVAVDGFKWPGDAQERATALLEWLQQESIAPEAAPALGDEPFVPSALPLLSPKDLQTRFGATFEQALTNAPKGAWFGPVASRFGYHLVWVHERQEASLPPFDAIRERVEQRFLHKVADEWLALRLQQLRAEFDIVVPRSTP
jgi:PPIC-type PPIASE domain